MCRSSRALPFLSGWRHRLFNICTVSDMTCNIERPNLVAMVPANDASTHKRISSRRSSAGDKTAIGTTPTRRGFDA